MTDEYDDPTAAELAALSEAATPGPWVVASHFSELYSASDVFDEADCADELEYVIVDDEGVCHAEDADFIVALVNAWRAGRLVAKP